MLLTPRSSQSIGFAGFSAPVEFAGSMPLLLPPLFNSLLDEGTTKEKLGERFSTARLGCDNIPDLTITRLRQPHIGLPTFVRFHFDFCHSRLNGISTDGRSIGTANAGSIFHSAGYLVSV